MTPPSLIISQSFHFGFVTTLSRYRGSLLDCCICVRICIRVCICDCICDSIGVCVCVCVCVCICVCCSSSCFGCSASVKQRTCGCKWQFLVSLRSLFDIVNVCLRVCMCVWQGRLARERKRLYSLMLNHITKACMYTHVFLTATADSQAGLRYFVNLHSQNPLQVKFH